MLLAAELVLFCLFVSFSSFCDPFLQIYSRVLLHFFAHAMYLFGKNSLMTVCFLLGLWLKLNLQKPAQVLFWLFKVLPFLLYFCSSIFGACMLSLATKKCHLKRMKDEFLQ